MTSLEALQNIRDYRIEIVKKLDIIEKDLDQLEKLKKENQELKEQVNHFKKVIEDIKNIPDYDLKVALVKHLGFAHMFDNCKLTPLTEKKEKK